VVSREQNIIVWRRKCEILRRVKQVPGSREEQYTGLPAQAHLRGESLCEGSPCPIAPEAFLRVLVASTGQGEGWQSGRGGPAMYQEPRNL